MADIKLQMMRQLDAMIQDVQEVFDGDDFRSTERNLGAALIKLNRRHNKLETDFWKQSMVMTTPKKWLKK